MTTTAHAADSPVYGPAAGPLDGRGLPDGFVALADVDPDIRQDMRYAGTHNFVGARIDGYEAPRCILTRKTADALARVEAQLKPKHLTLKVFDCYRPQQAVSHFMRWAADTSAASTKERYYPRLSKQQLISDVYVAEKSSHTRGSTADLTIVSMDSAAAPNPAAGDDGCSPDASRRGGALDMGTGFDCFDPRANTADASATAQQHANRMLLRSLMEAAGFQNYPREWWHYTLRDEVFPDRYFDFVIR